jgi:hypothetical protein
VPIEEEMEKIEELHKQGLNNSKIAQATKLYWFAKSLLTLILPAFNFSFFGIFPELTYPVTFLNQFQFPSCDLT